MSLSEDIIITVRPRQGSEKQRCRVTEKGRKPLGLQPTPSRLPRQELLLAPTLLLAPCLIPSGSVKGHSLPFGDSLLFDLHLSLQSQLLQFQTPGPLPHPPEGNRKEPEGAGKPAEIRRKAMKVCSFSKQPPHYLNKEEGEAPSRT